MGIMDHLRSATKARHEYVNSLPYFRALDRGELPVSSYIGHLSFLAIVYGALERAITQVDHPTVKEVWQPDMDRSHILLADLAQLGASVDDGVPLEVMRVASELARNIAERTREHPVSLLGYIYVLEGSSLGAQLFAPKIASNFNIPPGPGIMYYMGGGTNIREKWREFSTRMDGAVQGLIEEERILEAALEIFDGIALSLAALYPSEGSRPESEARQA